MSHCCAGPAGSRRPRRSSAIRASVRIAERALREAAAARGARRDRAAAHRRVHGGDGVGRRHDAGAPGRRLDHLARASVAPSQPRHAGRAGRPGRVRRRGDPRRLRRGAGPDPRSSVATRDMDGPLQERCGELWDRLLAACRLGRAGQRLPRRVRGRRPPAATDAGGPGTRARVRPAAGDARAPAHGGRAAARGGHGAGAARPTSGRRASAPSTARSRWSSRRPDPELLSATPFREARSRTRRDRRRDPAAGGDHPLREGSRDPDRDDHARTVPTS